MGIKLFSRLALVLVASISLGACGDGTSSGVPILSDGTIYEVEIRDDDIVYGDANAPVTVVEYASMTCGACAAFHRFVLPTVKEKYIDTGKVRLVFRPFPLDGYAKQASFLIKCVPDERRGQLIDAMFKRQDQWLRQGNPTAGLEQIAREATVSRSQFAACVNNPDHKTWLEGHMAKANEYGLTGTPMFLINGQKPGAGLTVDEFDRIMALLLPEEG